MTSPASGKRILFKNSRMARRRRETTFRSSVIILSMSASATMYPAMKDHRLGQEPPRHIHISSNSYRRILAAYIECASIATISNSRTHLTPPIRVHSCAFAVSLPAFVTFATFCSELRRDFTSVLWASQGGVPAGFASPVSRP